MKQTFIAELTKVEAKKLVSNDMEIRVALRTDDIKVLDLGKIPADQTVMVTISGVTDEGKGKRKEGFSYV